MAKRKLARKSKAKGARKHLARKHVAHRKVAKRVVRKQVRRAAPKKQAEKSVLQFGSAAKPVDHGAPAEQQHVAQPAGSHLDAPSAFVHPGAGQSSGAVKSDTRVQS